MHTGLFFVRCCDKPACRVYENHDHFGPTITRMNFVEFASANFGFCVGKMIASCYNRCEQ
jgi:hypothetical protein